MAFIYISNEWFDEVKKRMETDEAYMKKAKGFTVKWCNIITDCPGGVDKFVLWEIEGGKPLSLTVEDAEAPSEWRKRPFDAKKYNFRATGSYDTFAKLNKKELGVMKAVTVKAYKIDGPMMKLMGMMPKMNSWVDLMAKVPAEYEG